MIKYLGLIENPMLQERLRRWLTTTYGCTISRCVESIIEAQSLFITNSGIRVIIADLPPGLLLHNRFDEIHRFAGDAVQVIIINPGTADIFVPKGDRKFVLVPESRLESALNKVLHVH